MGRFDEAEPVAASSTQLGARLAVDEFNTANPKCQVTLNVEAGSGGDAAATAAAKKIVASTQVLAVVGPQRSGDVEVAGPVFNAGGVPFVSATATIGKSPTQWSGSAKPVAGPSNQSPV